MFQGIIKPLIPEGAKSPASLRQFADALRKKDPAVANGFERAQQSLDRIDKAIRELQATTGSSTGTITTSTGATLSVRLVTSDDVAMDTDDIILCDTAGGALTITLPSASVTRPRPLTIAKITSDTSTVTIDAAGLDTGSIVLQYQWQVWNRMNYLTNWVPVDEIPAELFATSDDFLKPISIVAVTTSIRSGQLAVHVDYMPPRIGLPGAEVIGSFKGVNIHTQDASDDGTWRGTFPYTGVFLAGDSTEYGTADFSIPVPASLPHDVWIHVPSFAEGRSIAYQKGVIADGVLSGVPYPTYKLTVTSGMAQAPATSCTVDVEEAVDGLGYLGRYRFSFVPPSADPEFGYMLIQGRWCNSSWVPATEFDADPGFKPVTSPCYSEWWRFPEANEYHEFRFTPVSRDGVKDTGTAPIVQKSVTGKAKKVLGSAIDPATVKDIPAVSATATPPIGLYLDPTATTQPFNSRASGFAADGTSQWYVYAKWTAETPTAERTKLVFAYSLADASWAATTTPRPLGSISIQSGSVDLLPQPYMTVAASNALMYVYVESVDGLLALCATIHFIISASPTGNLNPLQLKLANMDGFRFNPTTGKLEMTVEGVTARTKLGAMLGIDVSGGIYVTGIEASWVLASLVAVSGSVVVSNSAGCSIVLNADGTASITSGGSSVHFTGLGLTASIVSATDLGATNSLSVGGNANVAGVFGISGYGNVRSTLDYILARLHDIDGL